MSAHLNPSDAAAATPGTAPKVEAMIHRPVALAALFASLLGLSAGQRFLLPIVSAFICLMPLALAMLFWRKPAVRNSMTCLALLSKVDSSSIAYLETPGLIRLVIYAFALWALFSGFRISVGRLSAFLCYLVVLLSMTFLTNGAIDNYSLVRDVIALAGVVAVLGTTDPKTEEVVDVELVAWFALGLLGAEIANLAFFFDPSRGDYLAYDSLKCTVVFASLYMLLKGRLLTFFVLCAAAMFVLVGYATRMLLITYALVAVLLLFSKVVRRNVKVFILGTLCAGAAVVAFVLPREVIEGNRLFGMVYALVKAADWLDYLRLLDPVRYVEHAVFLSRPPLEILLGSGLGSGFIDVTGEFSFVRSGTGAFSDEELLAARYFRLHDAWIYFGLRLGLVFVLLAYGYFAAATVSKSRNTALLGGFGLILLNSATFSISGLLMTMLVAKQIALAWQQRSRAGAT